MATARPMSPGGALLRSSRMFSLPPPVPTQINNITQSSVNRSNSATLPYPSLQSITTPTAARNKGDWGFKRPFPLKSTTKTSTPLIRVKQVDTIEHVTDFASAADHTLTLHKFHEMRVPVLMPVHRPKNTNLYSSDVPRLSVFEETHDITDIPPEDKDRLSQFRWKFDGPWLAGMSEGEFQKYLKEEVKPKRAQFRQFLKQLIAKEVNLRAASDAAERGKPRPHDIKAEDVTASQLTEKMRELRGDRAALYRLVGSFLDLAPIQPKVLASEKNASTGVTAVTNVNPYAAQGPPVTHPSAGLSYLRTNAFIWNHPLYGPMKAQKNVKGRIMLVTKGLAGGSNAVTEMVGIGGFIANPPVGDNSATQKANGNDRNFQPDLVGGKKDWFEPMYATVTSKGNTHIRLDRSRYDVQFVAGELNGEKMMTVEERTLEMPARTEYRRLDTEVLGSKESFGLGGSE